MNNKLILILATCCIALSTATFAGNKDRSGQAAASELLLNPWAATGGLFGMNGASVSGLEAMKLNVAGLARSKNLELGISHNTYLVNADVSIVNAGLAAHLNEKSRIGVNLMSVNFGDIPLTSVNTPQGVGTTFKPQFFNISVGYAYQFGKNIDAGLNLTFVNEGVTNAKASAVGIDAGIMYTTGLRDELHFGVTLRNIGSNIRFAGDGLTYSSTSIDDQDKFITVSQRSEKFQLPTQLGISTAYDIYLGDKDIVAAVVTDTSSDAPVGDANELARLKAKSDKRLTLMGSFISNAFINDYLGVGAEFAMREKLFLRAGYRYEAGITNAEKTSTLYSGISAGAGFGFNISKERKAILDYAYKPTRLGGVHAVSIRLISN